MQLIATFGTDHYYQADGLFNSKTGPWLSNETPDTHLPACTFAAPVNNTYLFDCPGGANVNGGVRGDCRSFKTLEEAESACATDMECGGVTEQYGSYEIRAGNTLTPSPPGKPSISWRIDNIVDCRGGSHICSCVSVAVLVTYRSGNSANTEELEIALPGGSPRYVVSSRHILSTLRSTASTVNRPRRGGTFGCSIRRADSSRPSRCLGVPNMDLAGV